MATNRPWKTVCLLTGLACFFLLTEWNWFTAPFERDEGEYAYSAWIMTQGGVPYRDTFLQKPPMIIYTYWLAQQFSDSAVWPPRALAALFVALTGVTVWWITRREYGSRSAWISAWLFVPMLALPSLNSIAANTEKFMILPMMVTVALHTYGRNKLNPWIWAAAGASASLAMLYKPICGPPLLFVFSVWLFDTLRMGGELRSTVRQGLFTLAGSCTVVTLATGYFVATGAFPSMWEETVLFNKALTTSYGLSPRAFLNQAANFLLWWWPLLCFVAVVFWFKPARWWYYSMLLLLTLTSAYKDPNGHIYIMLVPLAAILASRGLDECATRLSHHSPLPWSSLLTAATAQLLCLPLISRLLISPSTLIERAYSGNPFVESSLVAEKVAQLVDEKSRIFIAGSEAQILFYAKRMNVSRFVITPICGTIISDL